MSMVFCRSCGKEIPETAIFCTHCGKPQSIASDHDKKPDSSSTKSSEISGISWFITALKKYAVFNGRARRKEFWFFILFNNIIHFGLWVVDIAIGSFNEETGFGLLSGIYYYLGTSIPGLAVCVRRLHDVGRSGWWVLFPVFVFSDSQPDQNKYGPNPKIS